MSNGIVEISMLQLVLCTALVVVAGIVSIVQKLDLERDLFIGSVRTFVQLFLMGYVLKFVFDMNTSWIVMVMFVCMVAAAVHIIRGRVKEKSVSFVVPTFISMLLSYAVVSTAVTSIILGVDDWWKPQYFIPLSGMIVGNSMTAISISLERLFSDFKTRRNEVEMMLALGADYREASQDIQRGAIKAGMIPAINSLMGVGLVSLPGMMTGQILSGTDPTIAVRYQIVVMLMLVGSTAMGALIVTRLVRRKCFSKGQQLIVR